MLPVRPFHFAVLVLGAAALFGPARPGVTQPSPAPDTMEADWMLGPFHRPDGVNPIRTPDSTSTFHCLLLLRDRWFLYYGTADSRVGVLVSPPSSGP